MQYVTQVLSCLLGWCTLWAPGWYSLLDSWGLRVCSRDQTLAVSPLSSWSRRSFSLLNRNVPNMHEYVCCNSFIYKHITRWIWPYLPVFVFYTRIAKQTHDFVVHCGRFTTPESTCITLLPANLMRLSNKLGSKDDLSLWHYRSYYKLTPCPTSLHVGAVVGFLADLWFLIPTECLLLGDCGNWSAPWLAWFRVPATGHAVKSPHIFAHQVSLIKLKRSRKLPGELMYCVQPL